MDMEREVRQMLGLIIETKRTRCQMERGPTDLVPMLHIVMENGEHRVAVVPDRDAIERAVLAQANGERVSIIGFLADAYGRTQDTPEVPLRGELAAAFKAGDPNVHEQLVVSAIDVATGSVIGMEAAYTYDDAGQPVFDEDATVRDQLDGAAITNLRDIAARLR